MRLAASTSGRLSFVTLRPGSRQRLSRSDSSPPFFIHRESERSIVFVTIPLHLPLPRLDRGSTCVIALDRCRSRRLSRGTRLSQSFPLRCGGLLEGVSGITDGKAAVGGWSGRHGSGRLLNNVR